MEKHEAYAVLSNVINRLAEKSYQELFQLVGNDLPKDTLMIAGEPVIIEIRVVHIDESLQIKGTAYGPSCWGLERLEEQLVINRPELNKA